MLNNIKQSILYPYKDPAWLKKLWILPLITLIPIIGIISLIILKGWRFSMVKNLSVGNENLPELDFGTMLKNGAILWVVMLSYALVPSIILGLLGMGGPIGLLADLITIFTDGFDTWVKTEPSEIMWTFAVYTIWAIISLPIYQAGMIRFAVTGNWKSLLNVPANTFLFLRYLPSFIGFYLYWLILCLLIFIIDLALTVTVIGVILIPVVSICLYYISSAYELGKLAQKIKNKVNSFDEPVIAKTI
ncbi:DUF4013 domain-containing protein [Paraglaciecola sp.]|uniref:DUF4013 domain-containing protein n=1 Tax=Paraglaciecola sp. TaxID=1920173 RepID=UPI00273F110B|nr:DUF4013 domain-containing protein [Paraglaciecola sp.]MDP5032506.1 DUF4013 domain-containing protein [Paraglaciecola sp.]